MIAEEPEWKDCIQGSNAVVNLAGMPISTRWSPEIKKEIKDSRIRVTSKVVDLINGSQDDFRPTVLVSATAVGYYGPSETRVFDEQSPSGNDYLAEVCREWEASALRINKNVSQNDPSVHDVCWWTFGFWKTMVFLDSFGRHSESNIRSFNQSIL